MRNFSIIPHSSQSAIAQYSDFLSREVYNNMQPYDVNNPLFLQQLGVLQAEGIRRATNKGFSHLGNTINSAATMLTSSLDEGFTKLNNSLVRIDSGIDTANAHLSNIHSGINAVNTQLSDVNRNLNALGNMVGVGFSKLYAQSRISNVLLENILTELKIPETQRERRYHIEQGTKYLSIALANGDKFYFEDAFDEFNKAINIERKDFFSWFNLGIIYLRSIEHIDTSRAISAFERFIHYAQAEAMHKKNQNLEFQIDDAHLYIAEAYYLQRDFGNALEAAQKCKHIKEKADFMRVKYLSATNHPSNQNSAKELLKELIQKNPYITLQVLQDDDILQNKFVIDLLETLRQDAVKKANDLFGKVEKTPTPSTFYRNLVQIRVLLQKQTLLDSYEAIYLMEKNYEWKTKNGALFTSTISDFNKNEKRAFAESLRARVNELEKSNKYEEAIKFYEELIELSPNDSLLVERKAYILYDKLSRYTEAIKFYDIAIKLNPNKLSNYSWKIRCLSELSNTEALNFCNFTLKLHPSGSLIYCLKGLLLEDLKKYDESIKCYEIAYRLDPQDHYLENKNRVLKFLK